MKKKWGAFIYVPVLAFLVAGGGAYIWQQNAGNSDSTPNQVYYLDEYFGTEKNPVYEAHVVDEKDVVLEKNPAKDSGQEKDAAPDSIEESEAAFVLYLEDDHVMVYRRDDMSESYMSTGIHVEDLPSDTLKEIMEGKEIQNEEALYFFLESHSS